MVTNVPVETAYDLRKRWGDVLRLERHRRRWTQAQLAHEAGLTPPTVCRVEDGRGSLDTFLTVANALDVELVRESAS